MKNKKNLFKIVVLSTVFTIGIGTAFAQNTNPSRAQATPYLADYSPYTYSGDYYEDINFDASQGMNGALRTSLATLIRPKGFYTYGKTGETHLATQLQYADEDPDNHNNMIYFYTRDSVTKNAASTWNREHVWCQSLSNGNWGQDKGGTDVLHIRPTYNDVNSSRNNRPYGDNNKEVPKYYEGKLFGYAAYSGYTYFEPIDQVKGDVARIIMYLWTTYNNYPGYSSLDITDIIKNYDTLLRWHTMDKPDLLEGNRNDYAEQSIQENRNPFVDHPELAWKIFGDQVSPSVKTACMQTYPAAGVDPIDPTGITLNTNSTSVQIGKTIQLTATLEPTGASGQITWSSNNTSVATVNANGLVTGKASGNARITASVGNLSAYCDVTVPEGINYGSLESPLSIEQAIEIIDANGSDISEEPLYVRGVVSSSSFSSKYSNYTIWLRSDDEQIEQAFELYAAVFDSSFGNTDQYQTSNALEGYQVICKGYAKKYNSTYELAMNNSGDPVNPTILQLVQPTATGITLSQSEADIEVGQTITLTASFIPSNSTANFTWESSDETIATVEDGVVTGVSAGNAVISAEISDSIKAECSVTVTSGGGGQNTPSSITLTAANLLGYDGNSISYPSDDTPFATTVSNVGMAAVGCAALGSGIQMRTKNGITSSIYNTTPVNVSKIEFTWAANQSVTAKAYNLFVEYSNNGDFSTLVGERQSIKINETTKLGESVPTASATYFRITHANQGAVYLDEIKITCSQVTPMSLEDYLNTAYSFTNLEATEYVTGNQYTLNFYEAGLENDTEITCLDVENKFTFTADKGTGSNPPKYYNNGHNGRFYANNTFTIASSEVITRIEFTFTSGYSSGLTINDVAFNSDVWTGSTNSITFKNSGTGQIRLTELKVTCGDSTTIVCDVAMKFCGSMPKSSWSGILQNHTISDYGLMIAKKTTLNDTYGYSTIQEAFTNNKKLSVFNKKSGDAPNTEGDKYTFNANITVNNENQYTLVVRAAAFIVIDDVTHFLGKEMEWCVKDLAAHYQSHNGCNLSEAALEILAGAQGE